MSAALNHIAYAPRCTQSATVKDATSIAPLARLISPGQHNQQ